MTGTEFNAFDRVLRDGLADDEYTCAVASVGSSAGEMHRCAFGDADPERGREATPATVFDLASVTKAVVTATVTLSLVEEGKLALTDAAERHLPAVNEARHGVSVRQLLTHTSGLQPYHFSPEWADPEAAREAVLQDDLLVQTPGERHEYSCLNFAHLAFIAEEVTGTTLPKLAEQYVFDPAMMETATIGGPIETSSPVAVTRDHEYGRGTLRGEIHDPLANALDGRTGNAGLFGTVEDIARFAQAFLRDARDGTNRLLAATTIDRLSADQTPDGVDPHGLGWRLADDVLPAPTWTTSAVGHTGYTGTSLWIDPELDRYCALLTNDVYTGKENTGVPRIRELAHSVAGAVPPYSP